MPARAQVGKGRDRLGGCSLSGQQYCVAIRDKLLGDSTIEDALLHAMRDLSALPPLGGDHRSPSGFALGPQVSQRFLSLEGVRFAGRVSQATYASRADFGRARHLRRSLPA